MKGMIKGQKATLAAVLGLLCLLPVGCAREIAGEEPPEGVFYFPIGLATSPDGHYAYVVNSNFDLRFNAGWLSVVDVDALVDMLSDGVSDLTPAIVNQLKIPSLGGQIALDETGRVAIVAHRGTSLVTLVEIGDEGRSLSCGVQRGERGTLSSQLKATQCDEAHLIKIDEEGIEHDVPKEALEDPFAVSIFTYSRPPEVDPETGETTVHPPVRLGAVGYLSSGAVTLHPITGSPGSFAMPGEPQATHVVGRGAVGTLQPHPLAPSEFLVATSQFITNGQRATVFTLRMAGPLEGDLTDAVAHSLSAAVGGVDLVDLEFSDDGNRAYASNRFPDSVVVLDSRLIDQQERDESLEYSTVQRPRFAVLDAVPIPGRPSGLRYLSRSSGDVLAAASFDDDALFLLSVYGATLRTDYRLENIGLGPFDMVEVSRSGRQLLLITTFFDHGLSLVDVAPERSADFRRVGRLRDDSLALGERER